MNGVLNLDKPAGITSHDVIARVRRICSTKRVGHAGTLDPGATGVLLVCVGSATRLVEHLVSQGKRYSAELVLGMRTDTQDISGTVLNTMSASKVTAEDLQDALASYTGLIKQIPPMVSAVHHEGKRLYELARQGITVDRVARDIMVHSISFEEFRGGTLAKATLDIHCGKGTYVRTLCSDIGTDLGTGGCMGQLRRTAVGPYLITDSIRLDELTVDKAMKFLRPASDALPWLPKYSLESQAEETDILHGRTIRAQIDNAETVCVVSSSARLIALARCADGVLYPSKVFPDA